MRYLKTAQNQIRIFWEKNGLLSGALICGLTGICMFTGTFQSQSATEAHNSSALRSPSEFRSASEVSVQHAAVRKPASTIPGPKAEAARLFPQDLIGYVDPYFNININNISGGFEAAHTEASHTGKEQDSRIFVEVQPGDNLSILFARAGFGPQIVADIVNSVSDDGNLARLFPGDRLAFEVHHDTSIASLELITSPLESFLYTLGQDGEYLFQHKLTAPRIDSVFKEAVISDSLFQSAQRNDIPAALALKLAAIFGGVVDFMQDTRAGDSFNLLYEEKYLHGESIGFGNILAAQFTNQGRTYTALSYTNANGETGFFNPEGESMQKAFLLNPVDFTRISSGFNPARRHPILNTIRAHKGTDYAAPKGTPVVATADGEITFADRKGSFGKLIVIQHGDKFQTRYAHLDAYGSGISRGIKVRQGQIIGYVGATGSATGPHLHYEFLMDGQQRDSRTIHNDLPLTVSLSDTEKQAFMQSTRHLVTLLENKGLSSNTLAKISQDPLVK